jgi:hypothetical protein
MDVKPYTPLTMLPEEEESVLASVWHARQIPVYSRDTTEHDLIALAAELDATRATLAEVARERDEARRNVRGVQMQRESCSTALAASQSREREYRRRISGIECDTDAAGGHSDDCFRCTLLAMGVVPDDDSALREVCVRVAHAAIGPRPTRREADGGEYYLTDDEWHSAIVDRILGRAGSGGGE